MISCLDWWPWTKSVYSTMNRRWSNNQWSGGIAAHPTPKFPSAKMRWKVLVSTFWNQDGIDYLPKDQANNAVSCSSLLVQVKENRCGKVTKRSCSCTTMPLPPGLATQKKLAYLGFQCLDHPPYSLDLAQSDYHLFTGLKKQLEGCHFSSNMEVVAAVETWFGRQPSEFFLSGLQKLEQWAKKFIELRGSMLNKSCVWSL